MGSEVHQPDGQRPALWNPNAAGLWSVLLTPAFGAYLHAANWRTLGQRERAAANMVWVWGTLALMLVIFITLFIPPPKLVDDAIQACGLALLVGWYYTEGRRQTQYVKVTFPDGYTKRGWGRPLALGVAFLLAYFVIAFFLLVAREIYRSAQV
jgi:hypothetical protein